MAYILREPQRSVDVNMKVSRFNMEKAWLSSIIEGSFCESYAKYKTGSERTNKTYKHESTGLPVPDQCSKSMKIWSRCDGQREHVIRKLQRGIKYGVPESESSINGYVKG